MELYFPISLSFCLVILPLFFFTLAKLNTLTKTNPHLSRSNKIQIPKSYPIVGSFLQTLKNRERIVQWTSEIVLSTPNLTFTLHRPFGHRLIFTANPANVKHILKTHFHNYNKGDLFRTVLRDIVGDGIFNADGQNWKFQRQVSSHEFSSKSLGKFIEHVVDYELSDRLIPVLQSAAENKRVLDFQDVLQRFGFDNICNIAFGYDPKCLLPSLPPEEKFAAAFGEAVRLTGERFLSFSPYFWKIKRALNIGSEKQLKIAVGKIRAFAAEIIREKQNPRRQDDESVDLLSRFLSSGHSDEDFVIDIIISFIVAGRDTTSAALTWFFWLLSQYPEAEHEIFAEIMKIKSEKDQKPAYDEVKEMVYTHAALCESMRLYPPAPTNTKAAVSDDVLPDGTLVKKGTRVTYHAYAMGRSEEVWGKDWAEFRPMRWLKREAAAGKWSFVDRDPYSYPVFQAGPRICLGKDMSFLQMKRVVAGVLRRFRVVPVAEGGAQPVYVAKITAKMKEGFHVRIEERESFAL